MKKFYVYAYLRENGTPYYIGKGCGTRATTRRGRAILPPSDKTRIVILQENMSQEEAYIQEKILIEKYGRKVDGGILHNILEGGAGSCGYEWTEDQHKCHRERMIGNDYSKGRIVSQEARDKISRAQTGKKRTDEFRAKRSADMIGKNRIPDHLASKHTLYNRAWRERQRNKLAQETTD